MGSAFAWCLILSRNYGYWIRWRRDDGVILVVQIWIEFIVRIVWKRQCATKHESRDEKLTFGGGPGPVCALPAPQSSSVFFFGIPATDVWWRRFGWQRFLCFSVVPKVTNRRQCSDRSYLSVDAIEWININHGSCQHYQSTHFQAFSCSKLINA